VRFLLEMHYHEVAAFWTRTNTMLVVMAAGLAAVVATSVHEFVQSVIALLGLVVTVAWWLVNRTSDYYQARWIEGARQLVRISNGLEAKGLEAYRGPLGLDPTFSVSQPSGPGATTVMYAVIVAFAAAWLALAIQALARAICDGTS
jgi:uncharacterized membrane protein YpjA